MNLEGSTKWILFVPFYFCYMCVTTADRRNGVQNDVNFNPCYRELVKNKHVLIGRWEICQNTPSNASTMAASLDITLLTLCSHATRSQMF